jgi:ribosome-binding factor A
MSSSTRQHRVADRIQVELSEIIRTRLKDPRRGFMTVTRVEVSSDLRAARVFVSALTESELEEIMRTLERAQGFLRSELGKRIRLRHTPQLQFIPDRSGEHAQRIAELLHDLHERGELRDEEPEDGEDEETGA